MVKSIVVVLLLFTIKINFGQAYQSTTNPMTTSEAETNAIETTFETTTEYESTTDLSDPWKHEYFNFTDIVSGHISFPTNRSNDYPNFTRLVYHITNFDNFLKIKFNSFNFEAYYDGVKIEYGGENFLFTGGYGHGNFSISSKKPKFNPDCDSMHYSAFNPCFGNGNQSQNADPTSWVGYATGEINIHIFTDAEEVRPGFVLSWEQVDEIDYCTDETCQNGGVCHDSGVYCLCDYPFIGSFCEHNSDPCNYHSGGWMHFCNNNGVCTKNWSNFTASCVCDADFTGQNCEIYVGQCDTHGCSHACFKDSNNVPQCACPAGLILGEDGLNCQEFDDSTNEVQNNFINPEDGTWRPLLGFPEMCVIKKYSQYFVGQPYALVECNPSKRKTKFAYDEATGFLKHNSDKTEWNNFCVRAEENNNSRLRVADCDANDPQMVWDYDDKSGHVYLRADRKKCIVVGPVGIEGDEELWMKISNKCANNVWGKF